MTKAKPYPNRYSTSTKQNKLAYLVDRNDKRANVDASTHLDDMTEEELAIFHTV